MAVPGGPTGRGLAFDVLPFPAAIIDAERRIHAYNFSFADLLGAPRMGASIHGLDFAWVEALSDVTSPGLGPKRIRLTARTGAPIEVSLHRTHYVDDGEHRILLVLVVDAQQVQQRPPAHGLEVDLLPVMRDLHCALDVIDAAVEDARSGSPGPRVREELDNIAEAAAMAARLAGKIVRLDRDADEPETALDLGRLVTHCEPVLHRAAGANIKVAIRLGAGVPPVLGSPKRFEQLLVALVTNSADSMFDGGNITVSTYIDEGGDAHLVVEDDGTGMQPWVRARILDPGFSTKAGKNQGGQGLETLAELVEAGRVLLDLDTDFGRGSRFDLRFVGSSAAVQNPPAASDTVWDDSPATFPSYRRLKAENIRPDDHWSGENSSVTPL